MPLDPLTLQAQILELTDQENPAFRGFPPDAPAVAANWSSVARAFFAGAVVPAAAILIPGGLALAEEAMRARMIADLVLGGPAALQNGFAAFAAVLAASVLPIAGVGAPPPAPLVLPILPPIPDPPIPAAAIATSVYVWALTGTVTPPPSGPPIPWR